MLQRMQGDILFLDPDDLNSGIEVLVEHGFEIEYLTTGSMNAAQRSLSVSGSPPEVDEGHFLGWLQSIVEPLGGDTIEAGLADPLPPQFA